MDDLQHTVEKDAAASGTCHVCQGHGDMCPHCDGYGQCGSRCCVTPPGHMQFTNDSGTWCHEDCPRPHEECGRLAVEQNDTPLPPAEGRG